MLLLNEQCLEKRSPALSRTLVSLYVSKVTTRFDFTRFTWLFLCSFYCFIAASKHFIMIRTSLLALLLITVVCSWCGKDFVSLGRYAWRCRSKIHSENTNSASDDTLGIKSTHPVIATNDDIKYSCGKKCRDSRGLKAHQSSCWVINGLTSELLEHLQKIETIVVHLIHYQIHLISLRIKFN